MKFKWLLATFIFMALLINVSCVDASPRQLNYLYRFSVEGYAYVTVFVGDISDEYVIHVPIEESVVRESLIVIDEFNELLPTEFVDSYLLLIYNINSSDRVVINYVAKVADIRDGFVSASISPGGPSKVYLPKASALVYFNGSANISITESAISLSFGDGGRYVISYIPLTILESLTTTAVVNETKATDSSYLVWLYVILPYLYYVIPIGALLTLTAVAYYLFRRRKSEEAELPKYDVETIKSEVDERDIEILKAVMIKELTISGLARELGLSKSVVWRRIRKLAHLKLITTTDVNGKIYIKVTPLGKELAERDGKSP